MPINRADERGQSNTTMVKLRLATNRRLTVTDDQTLLAYLLNVLEPRRGAVKKLLKFGAVLSGCPRSRAVSAAFGPFGELFGVLRRCL